MNQNTQEFPACFFANPSRVIDYFYHINNNTTQIYKIQSFFISFKEKRPEKLAKGDKQSNKSLAQKFSKQFAAQQAAPITPARFPSFPGTIST